MPDSLLGAIELIATTLPADQVELLADHVAKFPTPGGNGRASAERLVSTAAFRAAVGRLWRSWTDSGPQVSGAAIGLALQAAAEVADQMRTSVHTEVVWTGPASMYVPVRRSNQVLLELVENAEHRLTVASFAAYRVAQVAEALAEAARRGVEIRLILETKEDSSGLLRNDAADAFEALASVASFWVWPASRRAEHASMHVKAAIRDDDAALVTSANLTGSGLEHNMELGLLVTGGPVPRRLDDHFTALMEQGDLARVSAL